MCKIRLILTTNNNEHNIQKILTDYINYIEDVVIYDVGSTDNTKQICDSLLLSYNIKYQYVCCNNVECISYIQYVIDSNINDHHVDFLLLLNSNDEIVNLSSCLAQVSKNIAYYECIMYYDEHDYSLKNKFLISTKYDWKVNTSNDLIINKSNEKSIVGEYSTDVLIKRNYNYNIVNYKLIENKILSPGYDTELLFALGIHYYYQNNSKTGMTLEMFANSMKDTRLEYNKELLYYCYIMLAKYQIRCLETNDIIIGTITKAIEVYPNRAEAYSTVGNYFYKIHNYELCYYNLEKALSISTLNMWYMCYYKDYSLAKNYNLIIACILLDDTESAYKYLKNLKDCDTEIYKYFICLIKNNNLL